MMLKETQCEQRLKFKDAVKSRKPLWLKRISEKAAGKTKFCDKDESFENCVEKCWSMSPGICSCKEVMTAEYPKATVLSVLLATFCRYEKLPLRWGKDQKKLQRCRCEKGTSSHMQNEMKYQQNITSLQDMVHKGNKARKKFRACCSVRNFFVLRNIFLVFSYSYKPLET